MSLTMPTFCEIGICFSYSFDNVLMCIMYTSGSTGQDRKPRNIDIHTAPAKQETHTTHEHLTIYIVFSTVVGSLSTVQLLNVHHPRNRTVSHRIQEFLESFTNSIYYMNFRIAFG